MLFHIDPQRRVVTEVPRTTLASLNMWERKDLQEWILHSPRLLGEDLLVITSEFDRFDRTSERLDVLALDRRGKLVVVELKRSAVGTAADLQALRYAAYCSTLSLQDIAELHRDYRRGRGQDHLTADEAMERIVRFVDQAGYSELDSKPRVVLAAEEFPPEITATVLWLRSFEVDITCVRLRPHMVAEQLVIESTILIPLPEAEEFVIRRERKESEQSTKGERGSIDPEEFLMTVPDSVRPTMARIRDWLIANEAIRETAFKSLLTYRRRSDRAWVTWLEYTRSEVRVALPPNVPLDPQRVVRIRPSGWQIVGVKVGSDTHEIEELLAEAIERLDSPRSGA